MLDTIMIAFWAFGALYVFRGAFKQAKYMEALENNTPKDTLTFLRKLYSQSN